MIIDRIVFTNSWINDLLKIQKGRNKMKVLGITGGIGCGKSTVIDILREQYSCAVINTDQIAADLMQKGQKTYQKIVEYFGEDILKDDGEINRKKLANRVFKSEMDLLKLNSFTHPLVREEVLIKIEQYQKEDSERLIIVETALPYEARLKEYCDEVWYVTASLELRRERLKTTRGYSDEKINDIFNKQLSDADYRDFCTHVIVNDTTKEEVIRQARHILEERS